MAKPPATQNRDADDQIVVCVGWQDEPQFGIT
jgi:hypothetical protein